MNDKTRQVVHLVSTVLELPPENVDPEASMDTLGEWDSLAQLNICMLFQERFKVVMDMEMIEKATSIPALVALLPD